MPKQIVNISDTVKTFQEKVNIISADVGWRGNLTTTEDSDVVGAINEHDAELGTITAAAMGTTASTVSTAINELDTRLDSINDTLINSAKLHMRDASATNTIKGDLDVHSNVDISGNLQVDGTLTVDGVVNMKAGSNGSVTLGDANTDNVVFSADVNSHIIPNTDNTYDLGSNAQQWRNIHVHGTGNIDTVSADDITVSNTLDVNTSATIATAKIEDLTNNRIVIVGTGGELEDASTLTFDGTTFTVGATNIVQASGNTNVGGDLAITGNATSTGWALKIAAESGTTDEISLGNTITFEAGEGINTTVSNNKINITGEDATTTNKGVASFATADFNVSSGAVSIASIGNSQIDNSFINIAASSGTANAVNLGETFTITAGEGIDTTVSGNTITVAGELATTSNKGVASFSSANFAVNSGVVSVKNNGIILGTETTGNYMSGISGTANEITVVHSAGEGSSATVSLPDNVVIGNNLTVTNDLNVSGDIVLSGATKIAAHEFKMADGTSGTPVQNGVISIDRGTSDSAQLVWNESLDRWQAGIVGDMNLIALENDSANFTQLSVDSNVNISGNITAAGSLGVTGDVTISSDISIAGNLTVNGTTTTIDTTSLVIEDNIITLNKNQTGTPAASLRSGIEVERGDAANAVFQFNENTDEWEFTGPKTGTLAVTGDIENATITLTAGTDLSTGGDFTTNQGSNETITIDHADITRTDSTTTASPGYGATFTAIDSLTTNARGHVTGVRTKTITIPASDNTDTIYSLPLATDTVRGGIELFSNTDQSETANTVTTTTGRTYGIQLNSDNQAVVNVPWVDTNTTYSAGKDIDLDGTTFDIESELNHVTSIATANDTDFTLTTTGTGEVVITTAAHNGNNNGGVIIRSSNYNTGSYAGQELQLRAWPNKQMINAKNSAFEFYADDHFYVKAMEGSGGGAQATVDSDMRLQSAGKMLIRGLGDATSGPTSLSSWNTGDIEFQSGDGKFTFIDTNENGNNTGGTNRIELDLINNNSNPGNGETISNIHMKAKNSAGSMVDYVRILTAIKDETSTSTAGRFQIDVRGTSSNGLFPVLQAYGDGNTEVRSLGDTGNVVLRTVSGNSVSFFSGTNLDLSTANNSTSLVIYNAAGTAVKTIYGTTG